MWSMMIIMAFIILIISTFWLLVSDKRKVFKVTRKNLKFFFKALFIKTTVEYAPEVDHEKEYIIMPNHVSFFDIPLMCSCLPNYTFGIEAASHFHWPVYGFFIRKYGQLPIQRDSVIKSMRTFQKAGEFMKETGASLLVFPEGHRSETGKIQPLKKLPFKAAQTMRVPILPVGLTGMYNLSPKGGFFLTPSPVKVKYGKPISVEEYENLKPEQLAELVKQRIIELVDDDIV